MAAMEFDAITASVFDDLAGIVVGIPDVLDIPLVQWFENDAEVDTTTAHLLSIDLEGCRYLRHESRSQPVYLIHQGTYFVFDPGHIERGLLEDMANGPFAPGPPYAGHNEAYFAPGNVGI
jgi:hypothetical protein